MAQGCLNQFAFLCGCINEFLLCGGVELELWASCLNLLLWAPVQCVTWNSDSQDFSFEETWSGQVQLDKCP